MLMWIVIVFALALIFGLIKVDNLKEWWAKLVEFLKQAIQKAKKQKEESIKFFPLIFRTTPLQWVLK